MNILHAAALSVCALGLGPSLAASPPSWAPSAVSQTIEARCEAMVASLRLTVMPGSSGPGGLRIEAVRVMAADGGEAAEDLPLAPLPARIAAIDKPYLDRVVPTCTDNGVSFVLYLASEPQVILPKHDIRGPVKRLYVDVTREKKASIYSVDP